MSENSSSPVGGYLAAFAIGAIVGAGVAILYAPRSGKETRDLLAQRTRDLRDKAVDTVQDARDMIRGKREEVVAAVEAAREAMQEQRAKHAHPNSHPA